MPECSRGGEEHAHQAEERGRGGKIDRKGQKKVGEKRGQFRSQQKLPKSSAKESTPVLDSYKEKKPKQAKHSCIPRDDRRAGDQCPGSPRQTKPLLQGKIITKKECEG